MAETKKRKSRLNSGNNGKVGQNIIEHANKTDQKDQAALVAEPQSYGICPVRSLMFCAKK